MSKVKIPLEHAFRTSLAIAGKDFCVVAGDTRQSEGYSINSRYAPKVFHLENNAVLATGGMYADSITLVKRIAQRLEWYHYQHDKPMSAPAVAQMLSTMLYGKRFFPYFVWNTLGGLDENGNGCVFSYDPVGNYEKRLYQCAGSAGHLIQPFLDNQIGRKHLPGPVDLGIDDVKRIVKDAFTSATERDIYTGDFLEIFVITSSGVTKETVPLKRD
ncbi:Proteasome subunit beta type-1 [Kappamyces sp. JEL0829]|nr:Proteasome subunit beta type-1 [Kappamyces sp. JEL0829]